MKYTKLRILVIISIIIGGIIFYTMMGAIQTLGYMDTKIIWYLGDIDGFYSDRVYQYQAMLCIYIGVVLTIITFMVYPILYLRKMKKIRLEITK